MKTKLMLLSVLTLFIFSGCVKKEYVYVKTPCPKLQTYEVNTSKDKHFTLHYYVKDVNESKNKNADN
jgi:hypothetical protein